MANGAPLRLSPFKPTPRPATVDEAISGLLQAQTDLEIVAADREAEAAELRETAALILKNAQHNDAEALRANMVLGKLKDITEITEVTTE